MKKDDLNRFSDSPKESLYIYHGAIDPEDHTAEYDGDTIRRLTVEYGFGASIEIESVRLFGIDTPEMRGSEKEAGTVARDWLRARIAAAGHKFVFRSFKDKKGKYGRYLVELFIDGVNINREMVELGLAEINFYD